MLPSTNSYPHTFAEAKQWLAENPDQYDYEVAVDGHEGALMTRETWLASVADHGFIDYDGMGNELDADGNFLGETPGWIKPSEAERILPQTQYILWYNR